MDFGGRYYDACMRPKFQNFGVCRSSIYIYIYVGVYMYRYGIKAFPTVNTARLQTFYSFIIITYLLQRIICYKPNTRYVSTLQGRCQGEKLIALEFSKIDETFHKESKPYCCALHVYIGSYICNIVRPRYTGHLQAYDSLKMANIYGRNILQI